MSRAPARRRPKRLTVGILAAAVGLTGVATAATGNLPLLQGNGFSISTKPDDDANRLCLQFRVPGLLPLFGCGVRPTTARPIGVLIVNPDTAAKTWTVYGVTADDVAEVRLGDRSAATEARPGLPGRFFFFPHIPDQGKVAAVAVARDGRVLGRLGSTAPADAPPPLSMEESQAQGDLAGFAGGYPGPTRLRYRGHEISGAEANRLELSCTQTSKPVMICMDK